MSNPIGHVTDFIRQAERQFQFNRLFLYEIKEDRLQEKEGLSKFWAWIRYGFGFLSNEKAFQQLILERFNNSSCQENVSIEEGAFPDRLVTLGAARMMNSGVMQGIAEKILLRGEGTMLAQESASRSRYQDFTQVPQDINKHNTDMINNVQQLLNAWREIHRNSVQSGEVNNHNISGDANLELKGVFHHDQFQLPKDLLFAIRKERLDGKKIYIQVVGDYAHGTTPKLAFSLFIK